MIAVEVKSVADQKRALRETALARRDLMPADDRVRAARAVAATPFPVEWPKGSVISGFSPIKTEFNPLPLMRKLAAAGAQLAMPKMIGRGKPLSMRAWSFGDPLIAGVWGIREPEPDAPEVAP